MQSITPEGLKRLERIASKDSRYARLLENPGRIVNDRRAVLPLIVPPEVLAHRNAKCGACKHFDQATRLCTHYACKTCQADANARQVPSSRCPIHEWDQWIAPWFTKEGKIPCGLVIGSYYWPAFVELQIATLRKACGEMPILISDDCSPGHPCCRVPGPQYARLKEIATKWGVDIEFNSHNVGHAGGDIQAFRKGLRWAKAKGLKVLVKLSQRMIPRRQFWLQEIARRLMDSPAVVAGVRGLTDAVAMKVDAWNERAIHLFPQQHESVNMPAEAFFWNVFDQAFPGQSVAHWPLMDFDRGHAPADILWHDGSKLEDYQALADSLGISLENVALSGSHLVPNYSGG